MKTWDVDRVRICAQSSRHNPKTGRPSDWSRTDQRRCTGRWNKSAEYAPRYDAPPRG